MSTGGISAARRISQPDTAVSATPAPAEREPASTARASAPRAGAGAAPRAQSHCSPVPDVAATSAIRCRAVPLAGRSPRRRGQGDGAVGEGGEPGSCVTSTMLTVPRRLRRTPATRARTSSSRWAVGSSSSSRRGAAADPHQRPGERHPLQLPRGQALRRAAGQLRRADPGQRLDHEGLADDLVGRWFRARVPAELVGHRRARRARELRHVRHRAGRDAGDRAADDRVRDRVSPASAASSVDLPEPLGR